MIDAIMFAVKNWWNKAKPNDRIALVGAGVAAFIVCFLWAAL